jgi:hypothetical protein
LSAVQAKMNTEQELQDQKKQEVLGGTNCLQKMKRGAIHRQQGGLISLLKFFFKMRELG